MEVRDRKKREFKGRSFFMPAIKDEFEAERFYQIIRKFMIHQGYDLLDDRIYSIKLTHKSTTTTETVGEESISNGEVVIAIFETKDGMCLTCTKSRGFHGGTPLLSNPFEVEYFDVL